jgi:hypothetical protein
MGLVEPVFHNTLPTPTAVRLTLGLAQLKVALEGLMLTDGAPWSARTSTLAVAVQPLPEVKVTE